MKETKKKTVKIIRTINAWEALAPEAVFSGMTLEAFKAAMKPALDSANKMAALEAEMVGERNIWVDNAASCHQIAALVVNSVKGDRNYGDDCPLYAALGYTRRSFRKSGLTRKTEAAAAAAAANAEKLTS